MFLRDFIRLQVLILFCTSCGTIRYEKTTGNIYREFGSKSHYYSHQKENFGIELFHGFDLFDYHHKIKVHSLPPTVRHDLGANDWATMLILVNRLSPGIIVLQKKSGFIPALDSPSSGVADTTMPKGISGLVHNVIALYRRDTLFRSERLFYRRGERYRAIAYSYRHHWLKNYLDQPSPDIPVSYIDDMVASWCDTDYVQQAFASDEFLLQNASKSFWKSKNNYLFPLEVISRHMPLDSTDAGYYEAASTFNSMAGNYRKSRRLRDVISSKPQDEKPELPALDITDALPVIYDSARNHQVVILNEAHTQPLHRRMLENMLDSMFVLGYRHLFVETLDHDDSLINERKFPVQASGYYTSEPNFGNALRKALAIGYKLHAYDNDSSDDIRDKFQAKAIAGFMSVHKAEKILVYCGHGHIDEDSSELRMAYYLKKETGIDPFTIEQTIMTEQGDTAYEQGLFRDVSRRYRYSVSQSLINAGRLWMPDHYKGHYDMLVIQPNTHYTSDFPDWQFHYGTKRYELRLNGSRYRNCILQIFNANELKSFPYWELIPITNFILGSKNHRTYYLTAGKYEIYVTDIRRKIIYQKTVIL